MALYISFLWVFCLAGSFLGALTLEASFLQVINSNASTERNILQEEKLTEYCSSEYSCSGCHDIKICKPTASGYRKLMMIKCQNSTPYCDEATATCTSQVPLPCVPSDNFTCMRDGIFPDYTNCSQYHFCKDSISFLYTCPKSKYFHPATRECSASSCYGFSCDKKHGLKSYHRLNANYYAYCVYSKPTLVTRCDSGLVLDEETQLCELKCNAEGHYVNPYDCTKYYKCSSYNVLSRHQCPATYGFDPTNLRCLPLSMLPFCNPKSFLPSYPLT